MNIVSLSHEKQEATITFSTTELVGLCNVLYQYLKQNENKKLHKLHGDLMIARDISNYGHIDDFCFERIAMCRAQATALNNECKKGT